MSELLVLNWSLKTKDIDFVRNILLILKLLPELNEFDYQKSRNGHS